MAKSASRDPARLAVDDRIAEIEVRRSAVVTEILALEKKGVKPEAEPVGDSLDVEAMRLLISIVPPSTDKVSRGVRLAALHRERDVIDRALAIGRVRQIQAHADRVNQMVAAGAGTDWAELQRQRALAVSLLWTLNRRIHELRRRLTSVAGTPSLIADGFALLGVGDKTTFDRACAQANDFVDAVVKAGVVTRGEIENA